MNKLTQIYFDAAGGNFNASVFITAFHAYCHAIDDLIDGETPFTPETLLDVLMQANAVYSTPFYICLLYTSPSPRDGLLSRMPSSA